MLAPWATRLLVNAALITSQWLHRAWTVTLHPAIMPSAGRGRPQVLLFNLPYDRPGIERSLPTLVARAQPTVSNGLIIILMPSHTLTSKYSSRVLSANTEHDHRWRLQTEFITCSVNLAGKHQGNCHWVFFKSLQRKQLRSIFLKLYRNVTASTDKLKWTSVFWGKKQWQCWPTAGF